MKTTCGVELIRWPRYPMTNPHEIKVRVLGLPGGAETVTRRLGNLRRARRVARALAVALGCTVKDIDMRQAAVESMA